MRLRSQRLVIIPILVFLCGCSVNTDSPTLKPPIPTILPTRTYTSVPSQEPTYTHTPAITLTSSPQPTTTVTFTPLPVLSKDKVRAKFDQLYNYNAGCRLPCWWGITPGITTWGEALHFLSQFNEVGGVAEVQQHPLTKDPLKYNLVRWQFPSPLFNFKTSADFEIQNGIVVAIRIWGDVGGWMFHAKKLYTDYGQPNKVFIVTGICQESQNYCDAGLFLLYDENRFMSVHSVSGTISDKTVSLCIAGNSHITMWSPDVNIGLDSLKLPNSEFIPLQTKVFSIDPKTNKLKSCFDVSKDLWK